MNRIECDGCSGSVVTNNGGTFEILFNVDNTTLHGNNYGEYPVKLYFRKRTAPDIDHKFLCNEGEDDCSDTGHLVYLNHLKFKKPLQVYDDTNVPFSGKVFVADTEHPGAEGCMISNVEVCLIQERKVGGVLRANETLVCRATSPDGAYSLPVVIGSRVDHVNLVYHGHQFHPSSGSKFRAGMAIEDGYYGDNDFMDVEKAR
eukprot:6501574-Ditylum_brightwellii.AAC.1